MGGSVEDFLPWTPWSPLSFTKAFPICATKATRSKPSPLPPLEAAQCRPSFFSVDHFLTILALLSTLHLTLAPCSIEDEMNSMLTGTYPDPAGHEPSLLGLAWPSVTGSSDRHPSLCPSPHCPHECSFSFPSSPQLLAQDPTNAPTSRVSLLCL